MKMNMKKIISWGMMLAAAFTLTNCAKEIEDPNQQAEKQGHPFEIVASTVDTKTVNEGMATKWDDNDAINLFHAVAGEQQDYGTNDEFTIADVETGRFTGTLTNGGITVDAGDDDKVQVVLSGVSITNNDNPAIYVKNCKKAFVTANTDTENILNDGEAYCCL